MKKILALVLVCFTVFSFTSCNGSEGVSSVASTSSDITQSAGSEKESSGVDTAQPNTSKDSGESSRGSGVNTSRPNNPTQNSSSNKNSSLSKEDDYNVDSSFTVTSQTPAKPADNRVDIKSIKGKLKLTSRAEFDEFGRLSFEWSTAGFELTGTFDGDIYLTDTYSTQKGLLAYTVIDGDFDNLKPIRFDGFQDKVKITEGLKGKHTVKFFKAGEASSSILAVKGIIYSGTLTTTPKKSLTIDFIGDSITSASGLYTSFGQPDEALRTDATKGYAFKVMKELSADGNIISISGGAVCTAGKRLLRDYYTRTFYSEATPAWSFKDKADIVVINLGTNDTPSYQGTTNGTLPTSQLTKGIKDTVAVVRGKNPNAKIIWCYGMMDVRLESVYSSAISEIKKTDSKVYYCKLQRIDCSGQDGHPSPAGHSYNADILTKFIRDNNLDK